MDYLWAKHILWKIDMHSSGGGGELKIRNKIRNIHSLSFLNSFTVGREGGKEGVVGV